MQNTIVELPLVYLGRFLANGKKRADGFFLLESIPMEVACAEPREVPIAAILRDNIERRDFTYRVLEDRDGRCHLVAPLHGQGSPLNCSLPPQVDEAATERLARMCRGPLQANTGVGTYGRMTLSAPVTDGVLIDAHAAAERRDRALSDLAAISRGLAIIDDVLHGPVAPPRWCVSMTTGDVYRRTYANVSPLVGFLPAAEAHSHRDSFGGRFPGLPWKPGQTFPLEPGQTPPGMGKVVQRSSLKVSIPQAMVVDEAWQDALRAVQAACWPEYPDKVASGMTAAEMLAQEELRKRAVRLENAERRDPSVLDEALRVARTAHGIMPQGNKDLVSGVEKAARALSRSVAPGPLRERIAADPASAAAMGWAAPEDAPSQGF